MIKINKNDIGIAVTSTDRPECLKRLIKSIEDHTNVNDLHFFVLDDSSFPKEIENIIKNKKWINYYHTGERVGVSKNTNEAIKKLIPFKYKIIMNNDVEILRQGWEFFYFIGMNQTKFHHFCFQQEGLWGAGTKKRPEEINIYNNRKIKTIYNHPQGAILSFDNLAFKTVGYFDSINFKSYGYGHWDWSFRVWESEIQPEGIHDLIGSNEYFRVYDEICSTPQNERINSYQNNREIFNNLRKNKNRIYIEYE